jgi:probable HAF family extracellular repeat protein
MQRAPEKRTNMKYLLRTCTIAAGVSALISTPVRVKAEEHHTPRYELIDLGTFPGATFSQAFGLNSRGNAGGYAANADGTLHAFLWTRHKGLQDLGTLGGPNSFAGGPNNKDEVPVAAETAAMDPNFENFCGFGTGHSCVAAVWRHGVMTPLPNLTSDNFTGNNGEALGINSHGQLAGFAETGVVDLSCSTATPGQRERFAAVRWDAEGKAHELRPLPGDTVTFALTINNAGQVAGSSGMCSTTALLPLQIGPHAVLWERDGTPVDLGSLGAGTTFNTAAAMNDLGQVVGGASTPGNLSIHTFLWTRKSGMRDLGTVGKDVASIPGGMGGINNKEQVVGQSCDANPLTAQTQPNCRAYLWERGKMLDLNSLIPGDSPLQLIFGFGINDSGEITGYGVEKGTGDIHGFLLIPCDRD